MPTQFDALAINDEIRGHVERYLAEGVSARAIALRLGVTAQWVRDWLAGVSYPTILEVDQVRRWRENGPGWAKFMAERAPIEFLVMRSNL